jgi:hypothetical protein
MSYVLKLFICRINVLFTFSLVMVNLPAMELWYMCYCYVHLFVQRTFTPFWVLADSAQVNKKLHR